MIYNYEKNTQKKREKSTKSVCSGASGPEGARQRHHHPAGAHHPGDQHVPGTEKRQQKNHNMNNTEI